METRQGEATKEIKYLERIFLGGRLVLINSVLSNMILWMLCFFRLPKGFLQWLNYFGSRFFWQEDSEKKKYRLTKWNVV
jgi:hypothetical protein